MITIRISGPGMDIHLGVESLDDMGIVEAALVRVREHIAVSSAAKEIVQELLTDSSAETQPGDGA